MNWRRLIILCLLLSATSAAAAQTANDSPSPLPESSPVPLPSPAESANRAEKTFAPPPLKNLRYDEDFSYLRDASKKTGWLDPLKFIPLGRAGKWYLTVGGEARLRYETYRNANFGAGAQDADGFFPHRYMLHADFRFGGDFRVFAQIKSGLLENRTGGARPIDLDKLDLHQAFADYKVYSGEKNSVTARFGRQEAEFGTSRFVSAREGANVRQSFDGARLFLNIGKWRISPWFLKPVTTRRGVFDDRTNNEQTFFGIYAANDLPEKLNGIWVAYASRLDTKNARFGAVAGRERRDTFGGRIAGQTDAFDFNYEAVAQTGDFRGMKIRAWAIVTDSGFSFKEAAFKPRFAVRFDATSGDRNPTDRKLQTFNPLFGAANAYSGLVNLIQPPNSTAFVPSLELNLSQRVAVKIDNAFFWRTSRRDAVYGNGAAQRGAFSSRAKFVGSQPSVQIVYRINRYWSATAVYAHFSAGRFLRETPPAEDVDYFTSYLTFKF